MDIVIPTGHNLLLFIGAALVLLLIPGPAVLYVVARSVSQGRTAGIVSVCGIHTATLIHILAAALGLSVLVLSSALGREVREELVRIRQGLRPSQDEVRRQWDGIVEQTRSRWRTVRRQPPRRRPEDPHPR